VVGRQGLVAVQIARAVGLVATLVETAPTKPRQKGRVTSQSRPNGTYASGTDVTINAFSR
jgi:beta-lactam-binding protein with PASTA domain